MDRKSMENIRLDRRLIRRRDWIRREELQRELDALPDVSHKIAEVEEEPEKGEPAGEESPGE